MANGYTKERDNLAVPEISFRAFEEARDAVAQLRTLQPLLTPQDEETVAILMDKELLSHLERSLREEKQGKVKPLSSILE